MKKNNIHSIISVILIAVLCFIAIFWLAIEINPNFAVKFGLASGPGKPVDSTNTTQANDGSQVFQAEVIEIGNGTMLVKPLQGYSEAEYTEDIRIEIQNMPSSPEPSVGDIVEITYSGIMMEVYPPVPSGVAKIVVIKDVA